MNETITDKLISIINNINPESTIDKEVDLFASGVINSFGIITLIEQIEKKFLIQVAIEDMTMENFGTVHSIAQLIKNKQLQS